MNRRKFLYTLPAPVLGAAALMVGCAKKGGDPTYKKAFYSAHIVYGVDTLADLFEIFKNGGVIGDASYRKAIEISNKGLTSFDELVELLEKGWPVGGFDKARTIVSQFKDAVANGAIKFMSPKAQGAYANIVATVEVTINLLQAVRAGNQPEVKRLEAEQKAKASAVKASIAQADPTWYQNAIVRATRLATDLSLLSNAEPAAIWDAVRAKSKEAHDKNAARLK